MAPSAKTERDKKIKEILHFASKISGTTNTPSLANDLLARIHILPVPSSSRMQELDSKGTELWNLATRLNREPNADEYKRTLCLLRVFAFFLLDSGHNDRVGSLNNCVRLLKVAFKSAKICLAQQELELGVKILERAAHYVDVVDQQDKSNSSEDAPMCERLMAEYFILRTTLAWKQSKLDVAEHMFKKASSAHCLFDSTAREELADTLYEIGKDLALRKDHDHDLAAKWLKRSLDVLSEQDLEHLSDDASELKMATLHLLVKSLLAMHTDEARKKAHDLVSLMENDYTDNMVVSLLKLELLSTDQAPDPEAYCNILLRMIRSIVLTRENFKTLMHHLHKLRKLNPKFTCKALDELLSLRLLANGKEEWIERATIMRIWIITSQDNGNEAIAELTGLLDSIIRSTKNPFDASATHAAQILIWKQIETAFEAQKYNTAQAWCRLALHNLFAKGGEFNKAKICRKLMLCALSEHDFPVAREAFFAMPETGQDAAESQYLMYKLALRSADAELAGSSLEKLCKSSGKDATLMYACVLEAMQTGEKQQAVNALKKVLDKCEHSAPKGVHLPALLRCTIRLLKSEFDVDTNRRDEVMEELCRAFRAARVHADRCFEEQHALTGHDFTRMECEWFARRAYNLLLDSFERARPEHLTVLSGAAIHFINLIHLDAKNPRNGEDKDLMALAICKIQCEYIQILAHAVLARSEDQLETSLESYVKLCESARHLHYDIHRYLEISKDGSELLTKLITQNYEVLVFELEAILHLKRWADLSKTFEACFNDQDRHEACSKYWPKYADLAMLINEELVKTSQTPEHQRAVLSFLQSLINAAYKRDHDMNQLCKWIRVLFQISLKSLDQKLAIQCLDQATRIARRRRESKTPFDAVELEWLAATTFNHAVDFYSMGDESNCRLWAEMALSLAGEASDEGSLATMLREKYASLSWETEE